MTCQPDDKVCAMAYGIGQTLTSNDTTALSRLLTIVLTLEGDEREAAGRAWAQAIPDDQLERIAEAWEVLKQL